MGRSSAVIVGSACGAASPSWHRQGPLRGECNTIGTRARRATAGGRVARSATGEIRLVGYGEERLREAAKQGFQRAMRSAEAAPRPV